MAVASTGSPKISPQSRKLLFEVRTRLALAHAIQDVTNFVHLEPPIAHRGTSFRRFTIPYEKVREPDPLAQLIRPGNGRINPILEWTE